MSHASTHWPSQRPSDPVAEAYVTPPPRRPPQMTAFRPLYGLTLALTVLLVLGVVHAAVALVVDVTYMNALQALDASSPAAAYERLGFLGLVVAASSFGQVALVLATVVVFLVWLAKVRGNLVPLGVDAAVQRGRTWLLWSWFIPGVNLFVPFAGVNEIEQASRAPLGDGEHRRWPRTHPVLGLWWAAWLAASALDNIVEAKFRDLPWDRYDVAAELSAFRWDLAAQSSWVVAGVLCLLVVRRIVDEQRRRAAAVGAAQDAPYAGPGWGGDAPSWPPPPA